MNTVIMRLPVVCERIGLGRSTIYKLMSAGKFPQSIHLSTRAVGWVEEEIEQWIMEKIKARNGAR